MTCAHCVAHGPIAMADSEIKHATWDLRLVALHFHVPRVGSGASEWTSRNTTGPRCGLTLWPLGSLISCTGQFIAGITLASWKTNFLEDQRRFGSSRGLCEKLAAVVGGLCRGALVGCGWTSSREGWVHLRFFRP